MAAANTVVLSSSPLQGVLERTPAPKLCANMSSSPGLPSPSVFFANKTSQSGIGTRGGLIPKDALVGFASASTFLRQPRSHDSLKPVASSAVAIASREGVENGKGSQPVPSKQKAKAGKEFDADTAKSQKAPARKSSVAKKLLADIAAAFVVEPSPVTITGKTSSTKTKGPAQTKIKKGKVTKVAGVKPETKDRPQSRPRRVESGNDVSAHEESKPSTEPSKGDRPGNQEPGTLRQESEKAPLESTLPLGLEDATKRRKDWTPVKNTFDGFVTLESVEATPADGMVTAAEKIPSIQFGNLLGDYGFAQITNKVNPKPEILRSSSGEALTKRRKLELVTTNLGPSPGTAKPKKSKSPTKKPQTVTAKATEQFVPIDDLRANNIFGYFEPRVGTDSEGKVVSNGSMGNDKRAGKKAPAKAKIVKVKAAKGAKRASLLPPEAALEKVKDQDLLFGTSSQLVRDESPTFLRETQQAIRESELADETSVAAQEQDLAASTASGSSNESGLSMFTASRNLWSVAARDLKGALQEAEVVDLSVTPKAQAPLRTATKPTRNAPQAVHDVLTVTNPKKPDHDWTCIDDEPGVAVTEDANPTGLPLTSREGTVDAELSIPRSLAEASLRERPRSRSPIKKAKAPKASKEPKPPKEPKASKPSKKATQSKEPQEPDEPHAQERPQGMPSYRGFTTADLNKLVTSYGFKAIKRREDQIKLLEQCWESKHRIALQALPPNVNLPQPAEKNDVAAEPPKCDSPVKKRGRPPKAQAPNASKESENAIGNDNITPKPRGRPSKAKVPKASEQLDDPADKTKLPQKSKPRPKNPTTSTASPDKTPKASIPTNLKTTPPPIDHLPNTNTAPSPTIDLIPSFDTTLTPLTHTALLAKITEAITTYPPSHDMKHLTWHEKMLLYEPIVLEDLAIWLNREGLGRVGVDDEVGPGVVKEWCEGRSVCCLWRENLRGGARARH